MSVLLANIWTCLQGNQTSQRFGCAPPSIEEYLALPVDENSSSEAEAEEDPLEGLGVEVVVRSGAGAGID